MRELVWRAPPAVLADALGVSPGTAMRHAFLGAADWSAYAALRHAHTRAMFRAPISEPDSALHHVER